MTDPAETGALARARESAAAARRAADLAERAASAAEAAASADLEARLAQDESDRLAGISVESVPASKSGVFAEIVPADDSGTSVDSADTGLDARPRRRTVNRSMSVGAAVALVALVIFGAATSIAALDRSSDARDRSNHDRSALAAARQGVTDLLSVDTDDLAGYTERIVDQTTGELRDRFADNETNPLGSSEIPQVATGEVIEAGIERTDPDGTTSVLVWAKAVNSSITGTDANTLPLLLRVDVVPVGDGILKLSKVELAQ